MSYLQNNDNFIRYSGYVSSDINECFAKLFTDENINKISKKITELTMGVIPRPIIVPKETITSVLSNLMDNTIFPTGDIYSRYNIPSDRPQNLSQYLEDQAIGIIVEDITNNFEILKNNSKLTIWNTVLGDFNNAGLRSHSPIKVLNRKPNPMEFHMNY